MVKPPARKQSNWKTPVILGGIGAAVAAVFVSVILSQLGGSGGASPDDDPRPTRTATEEGEPTATPTEGGTGPTPTNTPRDATSGSVFLRESFDDASRSSVAPFADVYGVGIVANGELQMTDTADDGRLVWYRWDTGRSDVSIKMRAFADYGLITMACRDDNRYQVRASVESRLGSFKTSIYDERNESFSTYTDWTETPEIAVDAKATLELICRGNLMEFIVNGTTVASHTIEGTSGTLAWIAADGGVGSNVFIDDIVITTLN